MKNTIECAGIDDKTVRKAADINTKIYDQRFSMNHESLIALGHNGVPSFGYNIETFLGMIDLINCCEEWV